MLAETTMEEDAVLQKNPATMVKEIVMVQKMGDSMMEMLDVNQDWSVDQTTAGSLVFTTMRRMTAVTYQRLLYRQQNLSFLVFYLESL